MGFINIIKIIVDSKSELKEKLRGSTSDNLILGENSEVERDFYIFKVEAENGLSTILEIGVISEGHGLQPECKLIDERHICIGVNKEVHIIDIYNFLKRCTVMFDSLFYEFISLERKDRIIVLQELGLTCISLDGVKLWEHSTNVINDYKVEKDRIVLITDEFSITILKDTGEII
ncbi:MAG: hypothetical protein BWY15_01046 [Firmicutes bacterium ADurb.Bin193]|nr:MAG: hypothetical protein BWY15_01046 [Firmicutes bacterium ADurb.Bin193]